MNFLLLSSASIVLFIGLNILTAQAINCPAPGDVLIIDKNGVESCLYGSDKIPEYFGGPITDPRDNIRVGINIALGFLGVIVVIMIIYGGVLWLTAAGREEQVTKGRHTLMWATIGAIVVSIAWTIASYVLHIARTVG